MTIGDLTYSLGAVWDKASLENIKSGLASVAKTFIGAIGIASGAMAGVFASVSKFADVNDELGKMARNQDIAVGSLQALQYSFEGAGVSGSKVADVLAKLKEQKDGFRTGKADFEAFNRIGINPNAYKTTESYFNAVVDGLGTIKDEAEKSDLAKRLLGSADLKNLIDGGSEAIKKQKQELKEMGVLVNDMDYQKSAKFNDTLLKTTTILKGLLNKLMVSFMPLFTSLMEMLNGFLYANNELLSSGLKQFFDIIIDSSKFIISLFGRVIGAILSFKPALYLIAGLFLLWQLPLIATIGIVTAIFILFDELFSFLKGENSLIGDWLGVADIEEFKNKFPMITAIFQTVSDSIANIWTGLKNTFFNIWDLITGKINFGEFIGNQVSIVGDYLGTLKDTFLTFVNWISDLFVNLDLFSGVTKQIDNIKDTLNSFVPEIPSLDSITSGLGSMLGFAPAQTVQASPVASNSNTSNQTNNTYNISANVDASTKTIGEAIQEISNPNGY